MSSETLLRKGGNLTDAEVPAQKRASEHLVFGDKTQHGALDIEDVLDEIGGLGRYQVVHFTLLGWFWFWNFGTLTSVFANGPFCAVNVEGEPCVIDGTCVEGELTDAAETAGCTRPDWEIAGTMNGTFWSDCDSVSCQFNLAPNGDMGDRVWIRSLFDSSFFLGWLWSVPISGMISDRYGRRAALIGAMSISQFAYILAALSPSVPVYMLARHFCGVGTGSTSLCAYILGTEYCPRKSATMVKSLWSVLSVVGTATLALSSWAFTTIPGYNWRILSFLGIAPIWIMSFFAAAFVDESPRWVLVRYGETAARDLLLKVARRNGAVHSIRPPNDSCSTDLSLPS